MIARRCPVCSTFSKAGANEKANSDPRRLNEDQQPVVENMATRTSTWINACCDCALSFRHWTEFDSWWREHIKYESFPSVSERDFVRHYLGAASLGWWSSAKRSPVKEAKHGASTMVGSPADPFRLLIVGRLCASAWVTSTYAGTRRGAPGVIVSTQGELVGQR